MENKIKNNCMYCHKDFDTRFQKSKYCSNNCRRNAYNQTKIKGVEGIDYVICGVCSLKFKEINADHLYMHDISKEEYDNIHGDRTSEKTRKNKDTLSTRLTPELSKKLSDSHKLSGYIEKHGETIGVVKYEEMINNMSNSRKIESYIERFGEEIGTIVHREIQLKKAITLENQIKLYGVEEGTKKHSEWMEKQKIKNSISYFIELYGYDDGLNRWFDRNNNISIANSKIDKSKIKKFRQYSNLVDRYTRISLQLFDLENIDLRGKEYNYDLDHMVSKTYGFKNNILPEIIAHKSNLVIITMKENRVKRYKCSLEIKHIIEEFNKDDDYIKIINTAVKRKEFKF